MTPTKLRNDHYRLVLDSFKGKALELRLALRKTIHEDIDPEVALRKVFDADYAYLVGGYLVVYNLTETFWSETLILAEQLVFKLNDEGSFADVVDFLEAEARRHQAAYVCVGTMLAKSDEALARVYGRLGYSRIAINLAKEIT